MAGKVEESNGALKGEELTGVQLVKLPCFPSSTPWKDIDWDSVMDRSATAGKLYMRSGLVRKDLLPTFAGQHVPETVVATSVLKVLKALRSAEEGSSWVIKLPDSSNAHGMVFVSDPGSYSTAQLGSLLDKLRAPRASSRAKQGTWVVQRYVRPALIRGRKFHIRALVAVVGSASVCLYRDARVLLAVKPFTMEDMTDEFVHATNGSVQRRHPGYDEEQLNVSLKTLSVYSQVMGSIRTMLGSVFGNLQSSKRHFLPLPTCYEVFGVDVMLEAAEGQVYARDSEDLRPEECGALKLLEVNPCPSLQLFAVESLKELLPNPWALLEPSAVDASAADWVPVPIASP